MQSRKEIREAMQRRRAFQIAERESMPVPIKAIFQCDSRGHEKAHSSDASPLQGHNPGSSTCSADEESLIDLDPDQNDEKTQQQPATAFSNTGMSSEQPSRGYGQNIPSPTSVNCKPKEQSKPTTTVSSPDLPEDSLIPLKLVVRTVTEAHLARHTDVIAREVIAHLGPHIEGLLSSVPRARTSDATPDTEQLLQSLVPKIVYGVATAVQPGLTRCEEGIERIEGARMQQLKRLRSFQAVWDRATAAPPPADLTTSIPSRSLADELNSASHTPTGIQLKPDTPTSFAALSDDTGENKEAPSQLDSTESSITGSRSDTSDEGSPEISDEVAKWNDGAIARTADESRRFW
ncbi:unnamed protein product [Zymoseptoria tritici ST99CH_1A5]|uniref:Uncharacterized protein n=1 Tax=Zymoseptoria tritici ST99CH_1A5 TaxID=1276529 RepID=A0A1Y6LZ85_ZYMTR|nr:unnamed protein product [Zymoseptoria tritici ST99CH_1A5]